MKEIWWETHRPCVLKDLVGQGHIVKHFLFDIPPVVEGMGPPLQHMIFHSTNAGTGKTSLAYILADVYGLHLQIFNASTREQRGIGFIQDEVIPLAQSHPNVLILLDEADQLTPDAQSALKGVIEGSVAKFILTCNNLNKISPWLQSRCQTHVFNPIGFVDMVKRLSDIAALEHIPFSRGDPIQIIAKAHEGDLRNAIGALQTAALLEGDDREQFLRSLQEPDFDSGKFLRLTFKERAFDEAFNMTTALDPLALINVVFKHGTNSPASPEAKLRLIDAAITSRRDLIMGVEGVFVRHNFVRLLCGPEAL